MTPLQLFLTTCTWDSFIFYRFDLNLYTCILQLLIFHFWKKFHTWCYLGNRCEGRLGILVSSQHVLEIARICWLNREKLTRRMKAIKHSDSTAFKCQLHAKQYASFWPPNHECFMIFLQHLNRIFIPKNNFLWLQWLKCPNLTSNISVGSTAITGVLLQKIILQKLFLQNTANQEMFTNDLFGEFRVPITNATFNPAKPFEIY